MNILRYQAAAKKCGVSRMTLYRWATLPEYADMGFPKQVALGVNSVGFIEGELNDWLAGQAAKRGGNNARGA